MSASNRYQRIIEHIFLKHYRPGAMEIPFTRADIDEASRTLGIFPPKNFGDVIYAFRYRTLLPESIRSLAPPEHHWIIRPAGSARYAFVATTLATIVPTTSLAETKIPDATPGVIASYALGDEQALLARLRYNRLLDIFTGVTCYSLQSHLRTQVPGLGQVETDEIYIGLDRRGAHYVLPVQAKGGTDAISVVQVEQDLALCASKFPNLICRPIAAQFMVNGLIAMFELESGENGVAIAQERHYRLTPTQDISAEDLLTYRSRLSPPG
jgi:hypothetical protein